MKNDDDVFCNTGMQRRYASSSGENELGEVKNQTSKQSGVPGTGVRSIPTIIMSYLLQCHIISCSWTSQSTGRVLNFLPIKIAESQI